MKPLLVALLLLIGLNLQAQTRRVVLLEFFSTERCNNCPLAHKNLQRIFGDGGDSLLIIGHHAGFYDDPFSLPESIAYEWFYTPNRGTYAPAAMMDRTSDPYELPNVYGDGVPVFDGTSASKLQAAYAMAAAVPAYASLHIQSDYQADSRQLTLSVSGSILRQLPQFTDLRLNIFLTEDSVFTQLQSGAYGEYYHRHLARQCLTTSWGEPLGNEQTFTRSFTTTLPDDWHAERMQAILFVSNYDPTDRNNCQVLNAAATSVVPTSVEAISTLTSEARKVSTRYNLLGQPKRHSTSGLTIMDGHIYYNE